MKIIIPMAGIGKRMRPHTLSIPKPLIPVAGKPIVQRLAEDISLIAGGKLEEIVFVIGDFGKEVENNLLKIAETLGTKGRIYYQKKALGTAHAVYCAEPSLDGKVVVAFADTLFRSEFNLDQNHDGVIWVSKVDDPQLFGVVKTNKDNIITEFIEKPKKFVSDLAIIGIYYFKEGSLLRQEIKKLLDNDFRQNGEFQLTDVLENMVKSGIRFSSQTVEEWLDCGNKNATVFANRRMLEFSKSEKLISSSVVLVNSVINKPCYVGKDVILENSTIGPYVSIGDNTKIEHSVISNSIIQSNSHIINANLENSMIGNYVEYSGSHNEVSLGDYTTLG
jgi:glucose-1-phosphate thymidylyltransferase